MPSPTCKHTATYLQSIHCHCYSPEKSTVLLPHTHSRWKAHTRRSHPYIAHCPHPNSHRAAQWIELSSPPLGSQNWISGLVGSFI